MKLTRLLVVCSFVGIVPASFAQRWEIGGAVGGGFYTSNDVTSPAGTATAKIQSNVSGSAWLGNNRPGRWGGEMRFDYQLGDFQLSQGSQQATFGANSYALHYDFLWHFTDSEARVRPFVAFGGGIKVYRGTGAEQVYQPLSNYALLTKDQDLTGLLSLGVGVKMALSSHAQIRAEIRDYLTPFPKQVITPAANAKVSGWVNDFVPMVGLAYTF